MFVYTRALCSLLLVNGLHTDVGLASKNFGEVERAEKSYEPCGLKTGTYFHNCETSWSKHGRCVYFDRGLTKAAKVGSTVGASRCVANCRHPLNQAAELRTPVNNFEK